MLDDPDTLERLAHELLTRAAMLRASVTQQPDVIELPEADMERHLGEKEGVLRSHRRLGNCPGLWRSIGTRTILWLVGPTEEWARHKLRRKPAPVSGCEAID